MKRHFRLTRTADFQRVRRLGSTYAHPLVVLYALKSDQPGVRVGVTAGLAVGNAVRRNRAKRLLRAGILPLLPGLAPGCDLMLIARAPLAHASQPEARQALSSLLKRAGLLSSTYDG